MDDNIQLFIEKTNTLLEQKKFAELNNEITTEILLKFQNPVLYYFKCIARQQENADLEEIVEYAKTGLELNQHHRGLLEFHYIYHMKLGLSDIALLSGSSLSEAFPDHHVYQFWLGEALQLTGAHTDASLALSKGHRLLSLSYLEQGVMDKSLE